jgi:hypothetical protein
MRWVPPVWLTVPGAHRYAVSDTGLVRNNRGLMACRLNDEGYRKIKLVGDDGCRREHFVHVLVARAFLPPPAPGQRYVLHGNRDRTDCRATNLRWGTHADNHEDKRRHGTIRPVVRKLTKLDVKRIRASKLAVVDLARLYRLSNSHVREIRNRRKHRQVA